jgi:hypothetical protein
VAAGREMKVVLVFAIVLVAAATAYAYGHAGVSMTAVVSHVPAEPTALLLSGSVLLGLAGAVRRLPF